VGQFGFGGRAILPAAGFSAGSGRLKGGCAKIGRPPKSKLAHYWKVVWKMRRNRVLEPQAKHGFPL
jgi:hypothetical protein